MKWIPFYIIIGLISINLEFSVESDAGYGTSVKWTTAGWEHQITTDTTDQNNCDIYGDVIVYDSMETGNKDIFIYNLTNRTRSRLTSDSDPQFDPAIWGDRVVYNDYRNGNPDIYMFNLTTWTETRLTTNNGHQLSPDICGDHVVYQDSRNGQYDIYMYNISSSVETRIEDTASGSFDPRIDGTDIAWNQINGNQHTVCVYSIAYDSIYATFSSWEYEFSHPDIHEGTLVFEYRIDYGESLIQMWGIDTFGLSEVEPTDDEQIKPAIWGSKVVWLENQRRNIVCQDLGTGLVSYLSSSIHPKDEVRVWGDHIVYESYRDQDDNIYLVEMDYDHDGVLDSEDLFPDDPAEAYDLDGDRMGDNADPDADGDGVPDNEDSFYLDPGEWADFDGDGIGDNSDKDDDNDGLADFIDAEPRNPLNRVEDRLDEIAFGLSEIEGNIAVRLDEAFGGIMATYLELNRSLQERMEEDLLTILQKMDGIIIELGAIEAVEEYMKNDISSSLDSIMANLTSRTGSIEDDLAAGFDLMGEAIDALTAMVRELIETPEMNYTSDLDNISMFLEQLLELEEMVGEIEELNTGMSSQKDAIESTENTSRTFSVIIIVLLVILMVIVLAGSFIRRSGEDME
jgi:beta propeller repeat protein